MRRSRTVGFSAAFFLLLFTSPVPSAADVIILNTYAFIETRVNDIFGLNGNLISLFIHLNDSSGVGALTGLGASVTVRSNNPGFPFQNPAAMHFNPSLPVQGGVEFALVRFVGANPIAAFTGTYTFDVTDTTGNSVSVTSHVLQNVGLVEPPTNLSVNDNSLTPTFTFVDPNVAVPAGITRRYELFLLDASKTVIYKPCCLLTPSFTIPRGVLQPGQVYYFMGAIVDFNTAQGDFNDGLTSRSSNVMTVVTPPVGTPIATTLGVPGPWNPSGMIAEPVNTATGNYVIQSLDLVIPGRGLPSVFSRTYNSLSTYFGPLGHAWTHSYNVFLTEGANGVVVIKQGDGHREYYQSQGTGAFKPITAGIFSTLVKNADGTFTLTFKDQRQYHFDSTGTLTRIADRNGNAQLLTYDGFGNLATITDAVGRVITLAYDASNRLIQITDPIGRQIQCTYDLSSNLATVTDPLGGAVHFFYDPAHHITRVVDQRGTAAVVNTYDGSGRVISQSNGRGFTTSFTYDSPNAGDTSVTDPLGRVTVHTHDALLRLTKITDSRGETTEFAYDVRNNKIATTDRNRRTMARTFDLQGNVTSITNPAGNVTRFTYDGQNNLTSATNARGFTRSLRYSDAGNLISIQDALGNVTSLVYDRLGQLTQRRDARGNATRYDYDAQGNLTRVTYEGGGFTVLSYDGIGRLLRLTDPNGHNATVGYDLVGRPTRIIDPLGHTSHITYDVTGSVTAITDAKGNKTGYAYDEAYNLASVTDALGHATTYSYDANNNRVSVADPNGQRTSYSRDSLSRLTSMTDALGNTVIYRYDPVGNVVSRTDANGVTNSFVYDGNYRLQGIAYGDGSSVSYRYDENGNRTSMVDARGGTTYVYDAVDRVIQIVDPRGSLVASQYDAVGNRTRLTYADGQSTIYSYDGVNRLSGVSGRDGHTTNYGYDPAGNLERITYPNGASLSYSYDDANRLVRVANTNDKGIISSFEYVLDQLGNRVQIIRDGQRVTEYGYDALSQLIFVTGPRGRTEYVYDPAGNRLAAVGDDATVTYTYDAANRLLQAGGRLFSYDATGNRIAEAHEGRATEYHYDAGNRLIRVRQASTEVHYGYDGDGNKVARQVVEKDRIRALDFSSDTVPALPVILTVTGPESSTTYTYGHALISQDTEDASGRRRDPVELFYHFDGLGSVVNMTDSGGRARQEFEYGPWGESLLSGEDANRQTRFGFTGEERDEQTDLYYLRARWYDPSVGRFLSEDPFGFSSGDTNLYRYVFNNPISFRDPSGLAGIGSSDPFITGVWAPSPLSSFASLGASPLIQFASVGSPFASLGASPLMPFSSVGSPLSSLGVSPLISIASLSATPLPASTSLAGLGGPQPIEIVRLNGSVDVRHDGESSWAGVFSSAGISPSDWIRTHDASLARVVFSDGSVATIYERTVSQASNIAPDKFSLQEFLHKLWESVQHFMRNAPTGTSTPSAVLGIKG